MEAYILAAKRSPIGRFMGSLSSLTATDIGAQTLKALLKEADINPQELDACIVGQVLQAGAGQAPARQTALKAGLPYSTKCLTVNKVCGSGLQACFLARDACRLKESDILVAGGQESMSLAPHILKKSRKGLNLGEHSLKDSILEDGLINPYDKEHMGLKGELCAKKYKISRSEQDEFAINSYKKAQAAQASSYFKNELAVITVPTKKEDVIVSQDEEPNFVKYDKIPNLKPVFEKEGSITAANASKINDGASFLLIANEQACKKYNSKPLARIVDQVNYAHDPSWFTTAPIEATASLLKRQNLKVKDIDLFEINEAFSVVALAVSKELNIPPEKLNIHGGAVALGHPIGASGARILTTLVHALKTHNKKRGIASICLGGGEALSMLVETCD